MVDQDCAHTRFKLYVRCTNCRKDSVKTVGVPRMDDAPQDVDELLESQWLAQQKFACTQCESIIGQITAVTLVRPKMAA